MVFLKFGAQTVHVWSFLDHLERALAAPEAARVSQDDPESHEHTPREANNLEKLGGRKKTKSDIFGGGPAEGSPVEGRLKKTHTSGPADPAAKKTGQTKNWQKKTVLAEKNARPGSTKTKTNLAGSVARHHECWNHRSRERSRLYLWKDDR